MTVLSTNVTVLCSGNAGAGGGTATQILPASMSVQGIAGAPVQVRIYNAGVAPVFYGGAGVTANSGIALPPLALSEPIDVYAGDVLYAIANTVTTTLSLLVTRQ